MELDGRPLYFRVMRDLSDRITNGEFPPDTPIPTEQDLCRQYEVSRITVRRAIEQLVSTHLLVRRRGVGTFVRRRSGSAKALRLFGNLQDVLTFDQSLSYQVLSRGKARPPRQIQAAFGTAPGEGLYSIHTLNLLDGAAYAVSRFYFAPQLADIVAKIGMKDERPPVRYLEQLAGIRIESGEQTIEPSSVRGQAARLLGLKPGTPVLSTFRCYFATGHRPVEAVLVQYHPDRYKFDVQLLTPGSVMRS
ncbi:MAG: GntR family transcriptional regulator [Alphaproteobacteria bacterium]|nr:GntR family transcriptional regulator [Alphaproteobacteria bacterium]